MYGLNVKINALKGKGQELSSILLEAAKLMENESTCHLYIIGPEAENGDAIWMTEVWDSKEDHDKSLQDDGVRGLIGKAFSLMDGNPTNDTELKILGGKGL